MKITCVVDDRAQADSGCKAEHGAAFVIERDGRRVLFDTGQSGPVLLHNLAVLGFAPEQLDAIILSHGHDDHTGGLSALLDQAQGIPLYAHSDLFRERFKKTDTNPKQVGPSLDQTAAADRADLHLSDESVNVVPGVWTTGGITSRAEPEGRSPYHVVQQGRSWMADPYRDDLSVVAESAEGLVLICGCCHAGLLNTLAQVRDVFDQDPVAIVGGTHLVHFDIPTMEHVIEELRNYGPPQMFLGHCTGQRGFLALKAAFSDRVGICQAGTVLEF